MKKYLISPITTYCEEQELFATKIGIESTLMPLYYSVWGKSEAQSRARAEQLTQLLNNIPAELPFIQ